jgi:hypothetical protein
MTTFTSFGRTCPTHCKEVCCFICEYCTCGIEIIPTKPILFCEKGKITKNSHGLDCTVFKKRIFRDIIIYKE